MDGAHGTMRDPDFDDEFDVRRRLHPGGLHPVARWRWYADLWDDACLLQLRYRLPVRSGWWEDPLQLEALAALSAWVERYDSGEWDDPPGKLALLGELERVGMLLRDGNDPFNPARDRDAFHRHLAAIGAEPPPELTG